MDRGSGKTSSQQSLYKPEGYFCFVCWKKRVVSHEQRESSFELSEIDQTLISKSFRCRWKRSRRQRRPPRQKQRGLYCLIGLYSFFCV